MLLGTGSVRWPCVYACSTLFRVSRLQRLQSLRKPFQACLHCTSLGSGILQDKTADGPRALFIAGSDGRILRAWLPEDAGCSGSKDMAHAVAEAIERASEASSVPWFQTL